MAREVITVTGVEVASGNRGPYHKVKTQGAGNIFCFDAAAGNQLQQHVGQSVAVDVDRTPNPNTGKVFPKITAFLGAADPSSEGAAAPVVAGSSGAATGSRGGGIHATGSTSGQAFSPAKKDPLGLVTSLRQTSLNAAVACHASEGHSESKAEIIQTAQKFYAYLSEGLPLDLGS